MTLYAELNVKEYKIWTCIQEQFNNAITIVNLCIYDEIEKCTQARAVCLDGTELKQLEIKQEYYNHTVRNFFTNLFSMLQPFIGHKFDIYANTPKIGISFEDIIIDKSYINLLLQEFLVRVNCTFDQHEVYEPNANKEVKRFYIKPKLIVKHENEIKFNEPIIDLSNFKEG